MLQLDRRAELVGEIVLEPLDVRILGARAAGLAFLPSFACAMRRRTSASVSRTDRSFFATSAPTSACWRGAGSESSARAWPISSSRFSMNGRIACGRSSSAQQVRHRGARTADGFRGLLVRQLEFADQARERERFLERVQVLALDVLDERERDGVLVVDVAETAGISCRPAICAARQRRSPATIS